MWLNINGSVHLDLLVYCNFVNAGKVDLTMNIVEHKSGGIYARGGISSGYVENIKLHKLCLFCSISGLYVTGVSTVVYCRELDAIFVYFSLKLLKNKWTNDTLVFRIRAMNVN